MQTFFVVMDETTDLTTDDRLPEHVRIFHMSKQSIFGQIDEAIMAYPRSMALHMEMRNPITYLPGGRLAELKIKEVQSKPDKTILFIELDNCEYIRKALTYKVFCEIELFIADIIEQAIDEQVPNAWIGGVSGYFIVAMPVKFRDSVRQKIQTLFEEKVPFINLSKQGIELKLVFDNKSPWIPKSQSHN